MSPESRTKTRLIAARKLTCEKCEQKKAVMVLRGEGLCASCLNPDPSDSYLQEQFDYWTRQLSSMSFAPALDGSAVGGKK